MARWTTAPGAGRRPPRQAQGTADHVAEHRQADRHQQQLPDPAAHRGQERQVEEVVAEIAPHFRDRSPGRAAVAEQQPRLPLVHRRQCDPVGEQHDDGDQHPPVRRTDAAAVAADHRRQPGPPLTLVPQGQPHGGTEDEERDDARRGGQLQLGGRDPPPHVDVGDAVEPPTVEHDPGGDAEQRPRGVQAHGAGGDRPLPARPPLEPRHDGEELALAWRHGRSG